MGRPGWNTETAFAVVGAGAVGTVLARALSKGGLQPSVVVSRTREHAQDLAEAIDAELASDRLASLSKAEGLLLLTVPDVSIEQVARELASEREDWSGVMAVHTSGVLTSDVLSPLAERGARVLSMHPMQTLTKTSLPASLMGAYFGLEGSREAVNTGKQIVRLVGGIPIVLEAGDKAAYHLAGVMVSNFLVTLVDSGSRVLDDTAIPPAERTALLLPLLEETLSNLSEGTPGEVLTGPVVRGDVDTVRRHLMQLTRRSRELVAPYVALSRQAANLAVRSGRLSGEEARRLDELLDEFGDE